MKYRASSSRSSSVQILHIFSTADDTKRLIIVEVSTSNESGNPPRRNRILIQIAQKATNEGTTSRTQ